MLIYLKIQNTCRSRGNLVDKRAIRGHSVIPWGTPILSSRKSLRLKSDPSTNPTDFDFFDSFAATVAHTRPHPFPARVERKLFKKRMRLFPFDSTGLPKKSFLIH
ncbi:hypothetical protein V1478_011323 [Vespula squamosa]|uniref:Uncharacterized protein n=1 Tax=Vespula squamosa TaxID=30214 RepID=A0ABD2AE55_VESSQ